MWISSLDCSGGKRGRSKISGPGMDSTRAKQLRCAGNYGHHLPSRAIPLKNVGDTGDGSGDANNTDNKGKYHKQIRRHVSHRKVYGKYTSQD
ncbi:hypothetical protein F3Y22_tig00013960pilonHSYRG00234 [Hibiscus syriacus]|uniref:Uncharacterized protein n=1 Tax=Hibiscus syriacus TaxID=106335 RepID=A0A6A3C0E3_HIBSY|nr:hypothetical protein F3Y22_tig00013960pilonHSYRG00234 [Hibiscus syriacus]